MRRAAPGGVAQDGVEVRVSAARGDDPLGPIVDCNGKRASVGVTPIRPFRTRPRIDIDGEAVRLHALVGGEPGEGNHG